MLKNQTTVKSADFLREIFLAGEDSTRYLGSISKLARHLEEPVAVTGSIAANWHLLGKGIRIEKKHLNDIDVVAGGLASLRNSLSRDFLINHFHPYREKGKILIQLVDEEHGTRIDVFTPATRTLARRLTEFAIGDMACRVISAEDLLAKLLGIIYPVTRNTPIEPKYVECFDQLSTAADLEVVKEIWREYRKESEPMDFEAAAEAVRQSIIKNPGLLEMGGYSQDINLVCSWCRESETFPLAPRSRVYEIMGYV